ETGIALEAEELQSLVMGFKGSPLFPIVAALAFTGARRNEALALRWSDLDVAARTLRIERAIEQVAKQPLTLKGPKRDSHKRTITIDSGLGDILVAERERWLRIKAGVPDGTKVDLSLVKLPADALVFPAPPAKGEKLSFTKLRDPRAVTRTFKRRARRLGFPGLRLHD